MDRTQGNGTFWQTFDVTHLSHNLVRRYPSDGGWEYHVASSISEWIVATIFCFYILTFTDEFRVIKMHHPQIVFMQVIEYNVIVQPTDESA